ncbi:LPS translocon maturation chaperone LptM [Guyparkeria halophila]|uniref:LPS translocon maturation chaperone LptM n=1 Tax=Guyparkeria halophila TaxID=47960 RepID=UPI003898E0B5
MQRASSIPTLARHLGAGLLLATLLAGCGQKGPLYLPDDAPTTATDDGADRNATTTDQD